MESPAALIALKPRDVALLPTDVLCKISDDLQVRFDVDLRNSTEHSLVMFVSGPSKADVAMATKLVYLNIIEAEAQTHAFAI